MRGIKSIQRITLNYILGAGIRSYQYDATLNVLTGDITVTRLSNHNISEELLQSYKEKLMQCNMISISNGGLPSIIEPYENRNITECTIDTGINYNIFVRFDHIVDVNKVIVVPPIALNDYTTTSATYEYSIYKIYPAGLLYKIDKTTTRMGIIQIIEFE